MTKLQKSADLVKYNEEFLNGKLHSLCSESFDLWNLSVLNWYNLISNIAKNSYSQDLQTIWFSLVFRRKKSQCWINMHKYLSEYVLQDVLSVIVLHNNSCPVFTILFTALLVNLHPEIVSKFWFHYQANLCELINFYTPWNNQKTYSFLCFQGK